MIFVWQEQHWARLLGRRDRMPHALLLAGPQGGGKTVFAEALARRMLCEGAVEETSQACGQCPSCNWFASGNHPDFRRVEPGGGEVGNEEASEAETGSGKKKSDQIRIDQIRQLDDFLAVGTHRSGMRVILIQPAEAMNAATANALLKALEEPIASTLFILVTHNKKRLLPTILSRCHVINFPKPDEAQSLAWMRQGGLEKADELLPHAGGMPLLASAEAGLLAKLDDFHRDVQQIAQIGPVSIAGKWEAWLKEGNESDVSLDKRTLVIWLQKWVFDLLSLRLSGRVWYHPRKLKEMRAIAAKASVVALFDCYNELLKIKAVAQHPLNPRLFLEDMLSRYARTLRGVN